MKKAHGPQIECADYNKGKFIPISFTPKLNWKITFSDFAYIGDKKRLPKQIVFRARLYNMEVVVSSSPYSYGKFCSDCRKLGWSKHYSSLDTHDPEEALWLTELMLFNHCKNVRDFYSKLFDKLAPK